MPLPLEGIKVVDMTQVLMGPSCTMHLADQGADVIKVEPPGGEVWRNSYTSPRLAQHHQSRPFLALNRNKRGITVDMSKESGRRVVHRLAEWADVFVMNMRQKTAKRLEVDYDTLDAINPRLVYAGITGYGEKGPDTDLPGYDAILQARSGIMFSRRMPDGAPIPSVVLVADLSGSMMLSYAIMLALWQRQTTGSGQEIEVSLLAQALAMQANDLVRVEGEFVEVSSKGGPPRGALFCYQCADDLYLTLVAVTPRQWEGLCRVTELEHLITDPRFADFDGRRAMGQEVFELFSAIFPTRPRAEWLKLLREADVPAAPVLERDEVFDEEQIVANEMFVRQRHPDVGEVTMVNIPFTMSGSAEEPHIRLPAPGPGQHTDEVLLSLGYSKGDIEALRKEQAVG